MSFMTTARKATARKATAKTPTKTTTRKAPAARAAAKAEEPAATKVTTQPITVLGRTIETNKPTPEQLAILSELGDDIIAAESSGETALLVRVVNKFYRVTSGLFAHEVDKKWLDDGRIDGTITVNKREVAEMPVEVIKVWKDELAAEGNRAQRRAVARKRS